MKFNTRIGKYESLIFLIGGFVLSYFLKLPALSLVGMSLAIYSFLKRFG